LGAPMTLDRATAPAQSFLTARWLRLAMLNYEIAPETLAPFVPRGTVLDAWNGRTLLSVVGFEFLDTRVLGLPIPFHRDFEEVNLRFYVRRQTPDGSRRGVVFIKEIVPRRAIAFIARRVYNENYVALPMRHSNLVSHPDKPAVSYEWKTGSGWNRLAVEVAGEPYLAPESSEETFVTEHYFGYVSQRDRSTVEYQVEHPRWRVWRARHATLECDAQELYGERFTGVLAGRPSSAFLAEGSEVVVRRGVRLGATLERPAG